MGWHYLWWLIAIALGVAELTTGSFYLLVLAAGAAVAGVAALAGASFTVQVLVAALVSVAGALLIKRRRGRQARLPAARNADVNLDIGELVRIEHWQPDRTARVRYRGAEWDVELLPDAPIVGDRYRIREVVGSRLRVAPDPGSGAVTAPR